MHYTTREQVEGVIGAKLNLNATYWEAVLTQADLMIDTLLPSSFLDTKLHVIKKEIHYDVMEEFQLRNEGVVMIDSISCQFRDRTGWAEHLVDPQAYKWFANGKVLIATPYVNYTPNIFFVNYRWKTATERQDIPRYVAAAAPLFAASIILLQPKNIMTPDTVAELANVFGGGDVDIVRSISIEGISVSFDNPSIKDALSEIYRSMREAAKTFREQGEAIIKLGLYKPRF